MHNGKIRIIKGSLRDTWVSRSGRFKGYLHRNGWWWHIRGFTPEGAFKSKRQATRHLYLNISGYQQKFGYGQVGYINKTTKKPKYKVFFTSED